MALLRKLRKNLITGMLRRAVGKRKAGLFFERAQLIIERIILEIRHDFAVFLLIRPGRLVKQLGQFDYALFLVHKNLSLFGYQV